LVLYQQHSVMRGENPQMNRTFSRPLGVGEHGRYQPVIAIQDGQRLVFGNANQQHGTESRIFLVILISDRGNLFEERLVNQILAGEHGLAISLMEKLPSASLRHWARGNTLTWPRSCSLTSTSYHSVPVGISCQRARWRMKSRARRLAFSAASSRFGLVTISCRLSWYSRKEELRKSLLEKLRNDRIFRYPAQQPDGPERPGQHHSLGAGEGVDEEWHRHKNEQGAHQDQLHQDDFAQ
jgi:hypothetical protein